MTARNATVKNVTPGGSGHEVVTVQSDCTKYMRKPCTDCPWKKASVGEFPAEAFRVSAHTSYDMAKETFGCHSSGTKNPKTCAGFLLQGGYHNFGVRIGILKGEIDLDDVSDGGHELFDNYKEMAITNGVSPDDDCLKLSRTD
jgi:hypothetical protein